MVVESVTNGNRLQENNINSESQALFEKVPSRGFETIQDSVSWPLNSFEIYFIYSF